MDIKCVFDSSFTKSVFLTPRMIFVGGRHWDTNSESVMQIKLLCLQRYQMMKLNRDFQH